MGLTGGFDVSCRPIPFLNVMASSPHTHICAINNTYNTSSMCISSSNKNSKKKLLRQSTEASKQHSKIDRENAEKLNLITVYRFKSFMLYAHLFTYFSCKACRMAVAERRTYCSVYIRVKWPKRQYWLGRRKKCKQILQYYPETISISSISWCGQILFRWLNFPLFPSHSQVLLRLPTPT